MSLKQVGRLENSTFGLAVDRCAVAQFMIFATARDRHKNKGKLVVHISGAKRCDLVKAFRMLID